MSGYFDRGASAGGSDEGYFNREDITGPAGVGSATGGPGGVVDDDLEVDPNNPNIVRATPHTRGARLDETAGTTSPARIEGTYPAIIEGSDSERTGTSWGIPAIEDPNAPDSQGGLQAAREDVDEASDPTKEQLKDIGSWSTIHNNDTAGEPTGL